MQRLEVRDDTAYEIFVNKIRCDHTTTAVEGCRAICFDKNGASTVKRTWFGTWKKSAATSSGIIKDFDAI